MQTSKPHFLELKIWVNLGWGPVRSCLHAAASPHFRPTLLFHQPHTHPCSLQFFPLRSALSLSGFSSCSPDHDVGILGSFSVGTAPVFRVVLLVNPNCCFSLVNVSKQSSVKCDAHINDHFETVKFERVVLTKRIHCLLITGSAGNFRKLSSGFLLLLLVQPPTAHVFGILSRIQTLYDDMYQDV